MFQSIWFFIQFSLHGISSNVVLAFSNHATNARKNVNDLLQKLLQPFAKISLKFQNFCENVVKLLFKYAETTRKALRNFKLNFHILFENLNLICLKLF